MSNIDAITGKRFPDKRSRAKNLRRKLPFIDRSFKRSDTKLNEKRSPAFYMTDEERSAHLNARIRVPIQGD